MKRSCVLGRQGIARVVMGLSLAACNIGASAQTPLVVGVSYATGLRNESRGDRMVSGAKAYLGRINASGGINGRPIELVALEDEGSPERHAQNVRKLVKEHGAIALLGCVDDALCQAAAKISTDMKVPLIGPLSGSRELNRQKYPFIFRIRADYVREATVLARQLTHLACFNVALLAETGDSELHTALLEALEKQGVKVQVIRLKPGDTSTYAAAIRALGSGNFHAAVMNTSSRTIEQVIDAGYSEKPEWPRVLVTTSSGNLPPLVAYFKGRIMGFTQVVPNPEILSTALSRELDTDSSKHASPAAFTFDGMEGYLSARLLVEALRKAGPKPTGERLAESLSAPGGWDLSGFRVSFGRGRATGSDWVEIGVRGRSGMLVN